MILFNRALKSYSVDISYQHMSQIVNIIARSRRQAIRAAKQLWEPYLKEYDTEWPRTKKNIKYKVINVRRVK